jgi:hypothetical protein
MDKLLDIISDLDVGYINGTETFIIIKYIKNIIITKVQTNDNLNKILFKLCLIRNDFIKYKKSEQILDELKDLIIAILNLKELKIIPDDLLIKLCIETPKIYQYMVSINKVTPSTNHLKLICSKLHYKKSFDLFKMILEYKVIPTHDVFDELLKTKLFSSDTDIPYQESIVNILIEFGLTINLSDLKKLLNKKIIIDIKKIGIIPDNETLDICFKNNFFPQFIDKIKFSMDNVHNLFLFCTDQNSIIQIIEKLNLKCDTKCLQIACTKKYCDIVMYLLDKLNIQPDIECVENILKI